MTVLDCCSAPGGKATHIAEKMNNEGLLCATDLHEKKIQLVEKKAKELNLSIIKTEAYDARKLQEIYEPATFDRIAVDAPCTGLGVVRGKPDIKYSKTLNDVMSLSKIQRDILDHVAPLLKVGGKLIYSTCTVDRAENEEVVEQFLNKHQEYSVDSEFIQDLPKPLQGSIGQSQFGLQIFPQTFNTDGFFFVRFVKND